MGGTLSRVFPNPTTGSLLDVKGLAGYLVVPISLLRRATTDSAGMTSLLEGRSKVNMGIFNHNDVGNVLKRRFIIR